MSLRQLRIDFVLATGRTDLVVDEINFEDKGANFYIYSGQRWLERTYTIPESKAIRDVAIDIGNWYAILQDCRTVDTIWFSSTEGRVLLVSASYINLRRVFKNNIATSQQGRFKYYAVTNLRRLPEVADQITIDVFGSIAYTVTNQSRYGRMAVVFSVPSDIAGNLEVSGDMLSPRLIDDDDQNYWTEEEPAILSLAAARCVEEFNRNQTGVKDYEAAIESEMLGLQLDQVALESNGICGMEPRL